MPTHTDALCEKGKEVKGKYTHTHTEANINWQTIHLNSSRNDLTPTAALPLYCCFYFI